MKWTAGNLPRLDGRVALVTGANSGLGLETTRALAAAGARVIMACRNENKAQAALDTLLRSPGAVDLELVTLDLANLDSVRRCATEVLGKHQRLDLLINNAGVMAVPPGLTADGFETQMGVNHFGHFALTGLLLPALCASPAARVVNVSSMAHRWTPGLDLEDLDWRTRRYQRWQAYGDSKLANLYFTLELSQHLAGRDVLVLAAHPGYADTHLQYVAAEQKDSRLEKILMGLGNRLFAQSAQMGALPGLYAAVAEGLEQGDFIGPDGFQQMRGYPGKVRPRRLAQNRKIAQALWQISTQRTGVAYALD